MRVLLDTHTLLWWLDGDRKLSRRARAVIGDLATVVLVSAASAWEIATKCATGPDARYITPTAITTAAIMISMSCAMPIAVTIESIEKTRSIATTCSTVIEKAA